MKVRPQTDDPLHGNGLIYQPFGPNAERRNKHFRLQVLLFMPESNNQPSSMIQVSELEDLTVTCCVDEPSFHHDLVISYMRFL
jgi:hypothetical protein